MKFDKSDWKLDEMGPEKRLMFDLEKGNLTAANLTTIWKFFPAISGLTRRYQTQGECAHVCTFGPNSRGNYLNRVPG